MGGSGGRCIPEPTDGMRKIIADARAEEMARLERDVDHFLQKKLTVLNERDAAETRARIEQVQNQIAGKYTLDGMLFGGSVDKHTYVDGLSDVDALAVVDVESLDSETPKQLIEDFRALIASKLGTLGARSVSAGLLAVTVGFEDGDELQILPSIRAGETIYIPSATGNEWNETNPSKFRELLTSTNNRLGKCFIPAVKLAKAALSNFPEEHRLSGYHV